MENANDLVIVVQDKKIEFVNQKPLVDFGYSINDVTDKSIFDFIHVDGREKITEFQIKKAKNEGLPPDFDFAKNMTSFGLLMVNLLSLQLEGTVRLNSAHGPEFTIAFPIKIHHE